MATSKEIRRRIKSAVSTKQIIKAMELVSVVKMQKAVSASLASRPYTSAAKEILDNICMQINPEKHPLFKVGESEKKLVIVVTTDRGLCGSLNLRTVKQAVTGFDKDKDEFVVIGKKGRDVLRILGANIIAEFVDITDDLEFKDVLPILKLAETKFLTGEYECVRVVYPHFESTLSQVATAKQLLPLSRETECKDDTDIVFEPGKDVILDSLVPRILEVHFWQYLLESLASEHSARMVAMKNANENAEELIDDLTLIYNQTRQAGITRELAEISAGKMTLEG